MFLYISLLDPYCPGDEVYQECGSFCGVSCENYFLPPELQPACLSVCVEGCFCPPGLLPLNLDSSECVLPHECPTHEDDDCPGNMEYQHCGSFCGLTCENYHLPDSQHPVCTTVCEAGCYCPIGLVPLSLESYECVLPTECPAPDICTLPPETGPCR